MSQPVDEETVAVLRAAVMVLARRLRYQQAGDDDLSATEMAVLGRIGRCGPMTPGQLARAEHVQPVDVPARDEDLAEAAAGASLLRERPVEVLGAERALRDEDVAELLREHRRAEPLAQVPDGTGHPGGAVGPRPGSRLGAGAMGRPWHVTVVIGASPAVAEQGPVHAVVIPLLR